MQLQEVDVMETRNSFFRNVQTLVTHVYKSVGSANYAAPFRA